MSEEENKKRKTEETIMEATSDGGEESLR